MTKQNFLENFNIKESDCMPNWTVEEALEAVRQDGYALRYVKNQTPQICLEAVKQNGYTLQFVKNQTPQICLEAVRQNRDTVKYVNLDCFENADVVIINGIKYKRIY